MSKKKPKTHRPAPSRRTAPILWKAHVGVICRKCLKVLASWFRHDYKTCGCPNEAMVDGGRDYLRYGAISLSDVEMVKISPIKKAAK